MQHISKYPMVQGRNHNGNRKIFWTEQEWKIGTNQNLGRQLKEYSGMCNLG